jgi:hypothetical protein
MNLKTSIWLFIFCLIAAYSCRQADSPTPLPNADAAVLWGQMTLKTMTKLPANTPTYGSRALGFMGLTMYECVVNGSNQHQSLAGQLSGLDKLPVPDKGATYNLDGSNECWTSLHAKKSVQLCRQIQAI